jgi:hypothetical protein
VAPKHVILAVELSAAQHVVPHSHRNFRGPNVISDGRSNLANMPLYCIERLGLSSSHHERWVASCRITAEMVVTDEASSKALSAPFASLLS